ncbi:helix-turn-helix and ligand-binding sensor domain-containing protein [Formosa algae]|uniref:DNA-binding CsgD family transcriptional regulator/ligand-binding sensor domain-containing protein n=1 Tax=Formosa algae TaxID=225843 RepID=A0A9X0YMC8_9FLAO|nr:LuxR C-terminal-related transcriptional regulator [Formosa algae]MBP1839909.1 DNA-binding CsgD family transcriptional regulator/ligand-binding sensor domain-containing protein [Formosa algae]MDQ0335508.1 DNA-binding CsgD family transcriptional regulator/ligand-binding sensor domain-containing protein [Formosa algae]OEI81787.1 LuxR family transcriptional regulator [Formosa algae]
MKLIKFIVFFIFFSVVTNYYAQEYPPIQKYFPSDYGADNQNWDISQDKNKYIYIANNKGLLEFNGAKWELYLSPNQTIIRSVTVEDNRIYTGSYKEFGYWERNTLGRLDYVSLSTKLDVSFLEDEDIWNIITIDDWVLFQSLNRIYIYNKTKASVSIINSDTTIYKMVKVNASVYFQKVNDGVYEIVNGTSKLISNDPILKNNLLVNIYNQNGLILFHTEDHGFYRFEDNALKKWNISSDSILSQSRIYRSLQLKDDSYILGSISNGIFHIDGRGELIKHLNQKNGLSNNTILSVFEDTERNIWLGLENGINCVNIDSPFTVYNDVAGMLGSVNSSILYNGYLYLGTNQGLFYKAFGTDEGFRFIEGTHGAVWSLTKINDTLFCGHNSGTFIITKNKANLIVDVLGTWDIKPVHENLMLQGNYSGLYVLEKREGTWQLRNKIEGFNVSSRSFEFLNSNEVLVNHEYKGVFKLTLDKNLTKAIKVAEVPGMEKGLNSSLSKYQHKIFYANKSGVSVYKTKTQEFVKDSLFSELYNENEYSSGKLIHDKHNNRLWSFSKSGIAYLAPGKLSNTPLIHQIPLPSFVRSYIPGYENITYLFNNKYLYGTSNGYIILDLDKLENKAFKINLNAISSTASKNNDTIKLHDKHSFATFKNRENNVEFNYNIPEYKKYLVPEFQYKLDGMYNEWSPWLKKSSVLFENLSYGTYTFHVKARIGNTLSDNIETYSFQIERPWYFSNGMIVVYVLLLLLFSFIMHNTYKRHYKKQREKLLVDNHRELVLKELENKQQLMRFNNDKLRQDIESKNRELGMSTMTLIKKNELLNSLKKELLKVKDVKNIKSVIHIIDTNINNTDDWQVFEEAFNNADKDFLKKIKSVHPELTSNDLRLCAYLRLNLSSKEIAPLLNISPRSVEVKRYRLRKKMNLPHEANLTDYILEL